jgi:hypothetical protein
MSKDNYVTMCDCFLIITDDTGTYVQADPDCFDTDNIFKDSGYFITREEELELRKYMDNKLGYDWQEEYQIFYVADITTNDDDHLQEATHEAIEKVLSRRIRQFFIEEYKEE